MAAFLLQNIRVITNCDDFVTNAKVIRKCVGTLAYKKTRKIMKQ